MESNQRKVAIYISLAILVLIILSVIVFLRGKEEVTKEVSQNAVPSVTPTPPQGDTITVSAHGYVPEYLKIKRGMYINFGNFSETVINITSKDSAFPPLNIGNVQNNDVTELIRFDKPGTYEYYNSLKPDQKGTIVVE